MLFGDFFIYRNRTICGTSALLLCIFIFHLLAAEPARAQQLQELEITRMEQPAPGPVVFLDHPGQVVVIVRSSLTSLNFSSTMEILEQRNDPAGGEYRIVIRPENQILTVNAPGFISQGIQLRGLQPNDRFYYSVEPEARAPDLISVIFNIDPEDAILYLNGEPASANETVQLPPGQVNVRIEREGYRTVADRPEVTERNIQFNYLLSRVEQELVRIRTRPAGAEVFVNNTREGRTDADGVLDMFRFPGEYPLRILLDGYEPEDTVMRVQEGGSNEFSFTLLRNTGTLRVSLDPEDATVMINRQRQELRDGTVDLAPGMHSLEVSRANHDSYTETIRIERGQALTRTIRLAPHTGTLQLAVSPSRASVRLLDGQGAEVRRWSGSDRITGLIAGNYRVEVSLQGYESRSEQLQINRDEITTLRIELSEREAAVVQATPQAARDRFECGDPVTFTYAGETVTYGTVRSANNRCWLDRNLGASRVAQSSTDSQAYGDLFQWGRGADGHQRRNSQTTRTLSDSDQPGHGSYILARNSPWDWRSSRNNSLWQGVNGINNPCPMGYRLPTEADWEAERRNWSSSNAAGAFASPLKLPLAGFRTTGGLVHTVGFIGEYWSSTVFGAIAENLSIYNNDAMISRSTDFRALGRSCRCIKD